MAMGKWLFRIFGLVVLIFFAMAAFGVYSDLDKTVVTKYIENERLETIKPGWAGTPVDQKGRFVNDEFPFLPKYRDLLKWTVRSNPFAVEKKLDTDRLGVKDPTTFLDSEADGILWLGHAAFFIRLQGKGILIDPIFGTPTFMKRFVAVPSPLEKIRKVDYILLSHDHRDHMDEATVRQIVQKFPNAVFLAGLGSEDILNEWKAPANEVRTAGWFQKFDTGIDGPEVFFVPVRHWSRRGLTDTNQRLWGGFVIRGDGTTIFFGGDSGYGQHYREIGEMFPQIDYFLIGIGAYEPRFIMEANHNSPAEALKAFLDSGAKVLVPMHYGTFDLSDEPPNAPLKTLMAEAENARVSDKIKILAINGSLELR